jgi:hypothetical protein
VANYKIGLNCGIVRDFDPMPGCTKSSSFFVHLIVTLVRLVKPGGLRAVVATNGSQKFHPNRTAMP